MYQIYIYIIGFLMGIFLLISLLNFKFTNNYNNINEQNDIEEFSNIEQENNILETFKEDSDYDNEDEKNFINCNENIINNFKIDRLLKKHYLVTLISSYNKDNYDEDKKIWYLDNKNAIHSTDGNIKLDNNPEYIKFPLKPEVGGYNISNSKIEITPNYIQDDLGMNWEEIKIIPNDYIELVDDESPKFKKLHSALLSGTLNFTRKEVKEFPKIIYNNYIKVNKKNYKPIIDNLDVLKNISMLFTLKLKNIDGDIGQLLFLENSDNGNLISINIINSNKIKVNNIDDKCKEDTNCKKFIENLQNSINIHNNYYNNNSISNNEFKEYLAKKCEDKGEYVINKNMCEYINKTYNDEIVYHNQLYVKKKYTLQVKINTYTYNIYDVNEDIFNSEYTFMALTINNDNIKFYINDIEFSFKKQDEEKLLPLYPYIINKNKKCNIILYSFAIFNKTICDADMKAYKLYNNYYLYGINNDE